MAQPSVIVTGYSAPSYVAVESITERERRRTEGAEESPKILSRVESIEGVSAPFVPLRLLCVMLS
jgi:hypothetical protein